VVDHPSHCSRKNRCVNCSWRIDCPTRTKNEVIRVDIFTPRKRSAVMSRIRSTDSKPEVRLRKVLFARGYRYRKNVRGMPGTPDIVLPKHKYVIQVRGCFWHAHGCVRSHTPISNVGYWIPKLARNKLRDNQSDRALRQSGWRLRIVWECEISSELSLQDVVDSICVEIAVGASF
jgi:DNA mismatch endonuclease, patch repair protein